MSNLRAIVPARIARRWNAVALQQLCEIAAQHAVELDELRDQLYRAQDCADFWRDQATEMQLQLCEQHGSQRGLTIDGRLVIAVPSWDEEEVLP